VRDNARILRKNLTDAERHLWRHIRLRQIGGHKFRRQHPMGSYIADFACIECKLIVEVDGGQHAEQLEYDAMRTAWLEAHGYRVLRFWNNDVLQNIEGVVASIRVALGVDAGGAPPS
jgi:very-short-patch-repair endonuclease